MWRDVLYDEERIHDLVSSLIVSGVVFVNSTGGFIAGTLAPILFSSTVFVAAELAWYAPNGGGRELRESFEAWAKEQGANLVQFCSLAGDDFDSVHENMLRNGFAMSEINYVKVI